MDLKANKQVVPGGDVNQETVGHSHKEAKTAIFWPCHQGLEHLHKIRSMAADKEDQGDTGLMISEIG